MNEPVPTTASAHASHDLTLVAALAARATDLTDADHATARDQIAACGACTDLLADLVALQVALPTTSTPPRPRDFTLTAADAERLRAGGWRRVLGFFGSARDSLTRPLAVGLTTLGLAGLIVATLPSVLSGGASTAGTLSNVGSAISSDQGGFVGNEGAVAPAASAAPAESAAASADIAAQPYATGRFATTGEPDASRVAEGEVFTGAEELDSGGRDITGDASALSIRDDTSGLSVLFVVAGVMLIAGLGLFLLRWSARRLL